MITIGINGLGRVGRALFRILSDMPDVCILTVNDRVPPDNLAYLLRYDSLYGQWDRQIKVGRNSLRVGGRSIACHSRDNIASASWEGCQIIVDASGDSDNVASSRRLFGKFGIHRIIVTHAPQSGIDATVVAPSIIGTSYDPAQHRVISASICDAVAIAPILHIIDRAHGIRQGFITTLHPWLNYQNLTDGPTQGFYWQEDYQLGRASTMSLIPKKTTLVQALSQVVPDVAQIISAMSFRVPTPIVCAAELHLRVGIPVSPVSLRGLLSTCVGQHPAEIALSDEPLASIDLKGSSVNCTIDGRWLEADGDMLRVVLWYDNEWGYSSHVARLIRFIAQ